MAPPLSFSFPYQICALHGTARKNKLKSKRVRKSRKSGRRVCPSTQYPRCLNKHSGRATCAQRPSRKRKN